MASERGQITMGRPYPYPIIFGYKNRNKPFPVINVVTEEGGVQKFFSRTNYNLFIEDPADAQTLRLGYFLKYLGKETNSCDGCRRHEGFCKLFVECVEPDVPVVNRKTEESLYTCKEFVTLHKNGWGVDWESCPAAQCYLEMNDAPAEKRFLQRYLEHCGAECRWPSGLEPADIPIVADHQFRRADLPNPRYANYGRAWNYGQRGAPGRYFGGLWDLGRKLLDLLVYPALIPQVWLNSIFHPDLGPTDPVKEYLDERPSRVDFLMLESDRRHVIEIDDPGHYAAFKDGKYLVSEEQYTKNLRIQRRLEWEGWDVHRFSNWEILNAFNMRYFLAVLGLENPHGVTCEPESEDLELLFE